MNSNILNPKTDTPMELIQSTIDKVEKILIQNYPNYLSFENGSYTISRGSTQLMLVVRPFTDDDTVIECTANVVNGANITVDLMQYLLRKNAELHFGGFGLLFDGTITFSHSISGADVCESELKNTIDSVGTIADYYDDLIVENYGGKRACDLNFDEEL